MADRLRSGPNWIHGTENNPILDLAKETDTLTMNWDGRQSVVDALGKHLSDKEAAENTEVVWSIIEQAMKHSNEHSTTLDPQKSLYNFFEEVVEKLFLDEREEEAKRKRQTILQMSEMWGSFVGTEIQKQSLKFFWMEECIDGENLFVAGTYKKVLEKVAAPAVKAGIRFGCIVKKLISYSGNEGADPSVTVQLEKSSGTVQETFDEVVMTAPLGWLKTNLDAFEPALPQRLQEGIGAIGYGHLDKVSLQHRITDIRLLTKSGLHHISYSLLEYIHLHPRLHATPCINVRNLSNAAQRPSNDRPSPSARCRRLSCRPVKLCGVHILYRTVVRSFHKPWKLEPGSRQPRRAPGAHRTSNPVVLHIRRHKQTHRQPRGPAPRPRSPEPRTDRFLRTVLLQAA